MELRDYLQTLRRGWPTMLAVTLVCVGLAVAYLAITPKQYDATATIVVVPDSPATVGDLQVGSQFAVTTAPTYADLVDSAFVLGPAADDLGRPDDTLELERAVTAVAREPKSLIDITASADSGSEAAEVANAAAASSLQVIPALSRAGAGAGTALVDLQVVRVALEPQAAVSPVTSRIVTLGVVVGLALGLALTITRQALDTRLRRPEDLRGLTDSPLLTALARPSRKQRSGVVVRDSPSSTAVETYRSLRTNLSHLDDDSNRSLLFTAVASDRAGAQVPVNLAWSMAQAGRRVLLVDLDLRHAPVGEMLGLRGPGLAEVLSGDTGLLDVVQQTTQPGLDVALAGSLHGNASDLLSGASMSTLLRLAEQHYDYVVLHAPSVLSYTDAAVMSRMAGHTLVVVAAGRVRAVELTTALNVLSNVRVEPLGLVLADSQSFVGDMSKVRGGWARNRPSGPEVRGRRVATPTAGVVGREPGGNPGRPSTPDADDAGQPKARRAKAR